MKQSAGSFLMLQTEARRAATILVQLQDVAITTPAQGNLLRYNGTIWVNGMFIDWAGLNAAGDGLIVEHGW